MAEKLSVNQRVRELMGALGFENNVDGFYRKYFGKEGRSERLRTVVKDLNPIKTDFLVEIADKIAQVDGRKVNGHWLLTGIGEMFLEGDNDQRLLIETQRDFINLLKLKIVKLEQDIRDLEARLAGHSDEK